MKRVRKVTLCSAFGGVGGVGLGGLMAERDLFGIRGVIEVVGGCDIDPEACADFEMYTGTPQMCANVAEMTVDDLWRSSHGIEPDILAVTGPCQGGSQMITDELAATPKYQTMNGLSVTFLDLAVNRAGWRPSFVFWENVPNIGNEKRGGWMVREMHEIMARHGYVYSFEFRELGEDGGLAQKRKRAIGLWRLPSKVPSLCYQPKKKRVRACGEVIEPLPMPNDVEAGGPMHLMPSLEWSTLLRLALIPPGGDHRALPKVLAELEARRRAGAADPSVRGVTREGVYTVNGWGGSMHTIIGESATGKSRCGAVADPRLGCEPFAGAYGVRDWGREMPTIIGRSQVDKGGCGAVADPRPGRWFRGGLGVVPMSEAMGTIKARSDVTTMPSAVADPRVARAFDKGYGVLGNEPAHTIATKSYAGCGAYAFGDRRVGPVRGAVGPVPLEQAIRTMEVPGPWSIVDPSTGEALAEIAGPDAAPEATPIILRPDGYWNRPLTPWELLGLMSFPLHKNGRPVKLAGTATSRWRKRIGNALPPLSAAAFFRRVIASVLAAEAGVCLMSDGTDIWVNPWQDPDDDFVEQVVPLPAAHVIDPSVVACAGMH